MSCVGVVLRRALHFLARFNLPNRAVVYDTTFGYRGHARACYDFLVKTYPNKRIYFVTKKHHPKQRNFYSYYSVFGLIYTYLCKYQFYTVSAPAYQNLDKKITVQFWHGTPIKSLGRFDKGMNEKTLRRMIFEFNKYKLIIVSDRQTKDALRAGFDVKQNIEIAASPYIVQLHENRRAAQVAQKRMSQNASRFKILYAPTFRSSVTRMWDLGTDGDWMEFCKRCDIDFECSYHPSDKLSPQKLNDDILVSMPQADLLITDYSSVCFDADKIGIPTVLYQPDFYSYQRDRGISNFYSLGTFPTVYDTKTLCSLVESKIILSRHSMLSGPSELNDEGLRNYLKGIGFSEDEKA